MAGEREREAKIEKFDPSDAPDNLLESFNDFVSSFAYIYEAIAKEPPTTLAEDEAGKARWIEQQKRKVFLGKYASRNLQRELEEATTETQRMNLSFTDMVAILRERFSLSTNTTLANYKFRKLKQNPDESFGQFVIRVKHESQTCNFSCTSPECTVKQTTLRDQLIFGTRNDDIRRQALHEQLDMDNLVKKGRSLEAAEKGADKIKGEQKFKTEEQYSVNRMQPKKYSRKYQQRDNRTPNRGEGHSKPSQPSSSQPSNKCRTCSSRSCKGERHCPGKSVTCFTCNLKGHYRGSKACKKSSSARRLESSSETSDTQSEYESSYATPRSSTDTEVSDQEEEPLGE